MAAATVIVAAACTFGSGSTRVLKTGTGAEVEISWASHWEEDPTAKIMGDAIVFGSAPKPSDMLVLMSLDLGANFEPATNDRMRARLGELIHPRERQAQVPIRAIPDGKHPGFFIEYDEDLRMKHALVLVMSVQGRLVEAQIFSTDQGAADAERARWAIVNLRLRLPGS